MNLFNILHYTRKHGSRGEAEFISDLIDYLGELGHVPEMDGVGNLWVVNGDRPVLFTCHIDTCHKEDNGDVALLKIKNGLITSNMSVLGADDAVGIYANLEMLRADVKGTYLFTRGEECGLIGAGHIVDKTPSKLKRFQLSVEVDRCGKTDIVYENVTGKAGSIAMAKAMAKALEMGHAPSDGGIVTDVALFNTLIPENLNISAGYFRQHSRDESLDVEYVEKLVDKLTCLDWDNLLTVVERDVSDLGDDDLLYYEACTDWWQKKEVDLDELFEYTVNNPDAVAFYLDRIGVTPQKIDELFNGDIPF